MEQTVLCCASYHPTATINWHTRVRTGTRCMPASAVEAKLPAPPSGKRWRVGPVVDSVTAFPVSCHESCSRPSRVGRTACAMVAAPSRPAAGRGGGARLYIL